MMQNAGLNNRNNNDFQFSQQHNQPIVLDNNEPTNQKVNLLWYKRDLPQRCAGVKERQLNKYTNAH